MVDARLRLLRAGHACFLLLLALAGAGRAQPRGAFGPAAYTALGRFPTALYGSYYNDPTQTSAQVQPVITDPVTGAGNAAYDNDTADAHPLPARADSATLLARARRQIQLLAAPGAAGGSACAACQAALGAAQLVALAAPEEGPAAAVALCEAFALESACATAYGPLALGSVVTQVLANADVQGYDGQNFFGACPLPPTSALNLTSWFKQPKPDPLPAPKQPSGKRLKVLHLSDFHLDPRYATGSEANCTSGICCRENNVATSSPNETLVPAPRFGAFLCDSPYSLVLSALEAIPVLTGTEDAGFAWTMYTGDLVAHDPDNQLSHAYVEYTETVVFDLIRRMLKAGPTYVALGNHDSVGVAEDAPHSLGGELANQYNWNYDHVASLWAHEHWLPEAAVKLARAHYGAYMVRRHDGLRVITLNTNLWYRANWFNYINLTTADTSGMLRFLTDELQDAEDAGERVWIMGHVLSGWDGTNPLENPSNLFYQIVDRFSPHVIANIFWGHTHEDQLSIYYANNGTVMSAESALAVSWIGPSITPASNLNSGFRVYEVDSATFEILDAHTWKSDVNAFPELDGQLDFGPTYTYEYDTRKTYGNNVTGWGPNDPLNATWWHLVTEAMEVDSSLVAKFNTYQGKSSVRTKPCSDECIAAKICYIRSGSASIAKQNCAPGYGSVQGLY
ncbi:Metallo-dependent phosphatase-like protein [Phellopilus nigrolimitatus]|nr:Metallo-dependent phosphatase-like protein [Phellopilus nigrolimitatus]